MDFQFSADQLEMRNSVARIFQDLCDDAAIKNLNSEDTFFHRSLWSQLGETGIFALPFAEEFGGMGLSLVDLCTIIELQGESVAPIPLICSVVEAGLTVADSDNQELKERVIADCISGSVLTPVRPYVGLQAATPLTAEIDEQSITLNGRSGFVPYASVAQGLVIQACSAAGETILVFCDPTVDGIEVVSQKAITDEPAGYIQFENVCLNESQLLARGEKADTLVAQQSQRCQVALGALQLGCLSEGLKRTAAYVSERKQFGRTLGSFQAVSQQAADAYMEIESLRSVYWRALDDIEQGVSLEMSAPVVKYWVAEAGHKAAHAEMHLHGGIGQDLDYPIHRFFLFAKHAERYLGSPTDMAELLGSRLMEMSSTELEDQCL